METTMKTNKTSTKKQKCKWIRKKYPSRPEVFESFAKWMAFPRSAREPKTQGQFAKIHEISPNSLSAYKQKPEFWKLVKENKEKLEWDIQNKIKLDEIFKTLG